MKNITFLMILSALLVTGCDKGADNATSSEANDSVETAVENVQEATGEAAEAIGEAAESVEEAAREAAE